MREFSDEATAAFIRRTLCSQKIQASGHLSDHGQSSVNDVLPPLTTSNALDLQLYAFVAILFKDAVHSWYGKITADQEFRDEILHIVAHCSRALEQRLRDADLETLLLDDLPGLVEAHTEGA